MRAEIKDAEADSLHLSSDVVSIIVSGISALPLLVSALLLFIEKRRAGKIIIVGASGRKIEIPRDTPPERVEYYIDLAKKLDWSIDHISISLT